MTGSTYDLTNAELSALSASNGAGGISNYTSFAKYLIAQQGDKFLENTISSTYVLLNAENYQALLDSFGREGARMGSQITNAKAIRARLGDTQTSSEWHRENHYAGSQALSALAIGVPIAGLAYDHGSTTAAYVTVAVAVVIAMVFYSGSLVHTRRDPVKLYWAPPSTK